MGEAPTAGAERGAVAVRETVGFGLVRRGSDRTEEVGGSGQSVRRDAFNDRDRDTGEADMVEGGCCGGQGANCF